MAKKIGYWAMMVLIILILNASSITWLVYNFVPSPQVPDVSLWDVSVLKNQLQLQPSEYLSVAEKGSIYLFMMFGFACTAGFIRWLFVDTITQVREKAKEKKKELKRFLKDEN